MTEKPDRQRIDQWLWHARFFKTRTLSQKMLIAGKVRLNNQKIRDPSKTLFPGSILTITRPHTVDVVEVLHLSERRGSAVEAQLLYRSLNQG